MIREEVEGLRRQSPIEVVVGRYVALTYDHRVVDGREAVQSLLKVKEPVEDPEGLLLEG
jgi:pyruvate/2-oxoglutarate dehydrogenase complex dihydrolipoamide acyltransferase (E2) component